jgi:hypothetical protein
MLYDVLKSHSNLDSKLQAWKDLHEDTDTDDQLEYLQDFQHDDDDILLSGEFAQYDADTLSPLEDDQDYADHLTADFAVRGDDHTRSLFIQLPEDGEPEEDFDVDLYAGSALITLQTNTEDDDFTTSYVHYNVNNNVHSHNGDVLDNDYDVTIYEYQEGGDTYTDTVVSDDSEDFDVNLYSGSALITLHTNTEDDDVTTSYVYYNANKNVHSHNGDVLDNDYDVTIYECQDGGDTYTDTDVSDDSEDFDVNLYGGSALITLQANTEDDDVTTSYVQYNANNNAHSRNGDVLDNDYDVSIYECQDGGETYTDTVVSDDSEDVDFSKDGDEKVSVVEEKEVVDVYNPDEDDIVLIVDRLLGDDELLTLQGSHFLQL